MNAALHALANDLHDGLQNGSGLVLQVLRQAVSDTVAFVSHDVAFFVQLATAVAPFGAKHVGIMA